MAAKPTDTAHPAGFARRRVLNWFPLGLMYASFYMSRYNLSVANPYIREQYGWTKDQFGWIITVGLLVYGLAVLFNGPIADRIGGRKAILIGAAGAMGANVIFGIGAWTPALAFFAVAYMINMYFQTFGALSVVKVNAAWFKRSERGAFAGIFGGMIQFGRILAYAVGGFICARLPWQWAFWVPAVVLALVGIWNYFYVRNTPEELGFPRVDEVLEGEEEGEKPTYGYILRKIFGNPTLWIIAGAMMCTGLVRHTIEQWGPSYFKDVFGLNSDTFIYQFAFNGTVVVGILGALVMGTVSDRYFQSRRGPITAVAYLMQCLLLVVFALALPVRQMHLDLPFKATGEQMSGLTTRANVMMRQGAAPAEIEREITGLALALPHEPGVTGSHRISVPYTAGKPIVAAVLLILIYFFLNGCHGLLAGTASMDFGGRKAAASAAGLLDGSQYLVGSLTGIGMGKLLEAAGWSAWAWSIAPVALIGFFLMLSRWNVLPKDARGAAH
jgi:OPA family glycerol-3-phosphate transporter-like MFS transporter